MIICDSCSMPVILIDEAHSPSLADPLGEEDWCKECSRAFSEFYRNTKAQYLDKVYEETLEKMKVYLKGRFK